jgi:adenylate cyclase
MKTGYIYQSEKNSFFTKKISPGFIYQVIGWVIAANFFIMLKSWGIVDTTGFLVFAHRSLFVVHIEASIMGLCLGLILAYLDKIRLQISGQKKIFGIVIIIKALAHLACIIIIITIVAFIFLLFFGAGLEEAFSRIGRFVTTIYFLTIVIYGAFVSILFSFIKQVDSKFGPGNLMNMLVGKYHSPRVEDRIFLFIDLKDATECAEQLGHIEYSQLLQDCFYDINSMITRYHGEIYQYVGDEIVITWESPRGLKNLNCIHLYYNFMKKIHEHSDYYLSKFGLVPEFKAGMNCGHVTVAEVGIIKREIAYHGDTINTASRIQHQCNKYGKRLLISGQLYNRLGECKDYKIIPTDLATLKGKKNPVELYSVDE